LRIVLADAALEAEASAAEVPRWSGLVERSCVGELHHQRVQEAGVSLAASERSSRAKLAIAD